MAIGVTGSGGDYDIYNMYSTTLEDLLKKLRIVVLPNDGRPIIDYLDPETGKNSYQRRIHYYHTPEGYEVKLAVHDNTLFIQSPIKRF